MQLLLDSSHGAVGGEGAGALVAGPGFVGSSAVRALGAAVQNAAEGATGLIDAGPAVGRRGDFSAFVLAAWSRATQGHGRARRRGRRLSAAIDGSGRLDAAALVIIRGRRPVMPRLELLKRFLEGTHRGGGDARALPVCVVRLPERKVGASRRGVCYC
jgi:hypothetical protein